MHVVDVQQQHAAAAPCQFGQKVDLIPFLAGQLQVMTRVLDGDAATLEVRYPFDVSLFAHHDPDGFVVEARERAQGRGIDARRGTTLDKGDIRLAFLQQMDVFDRAGSRTHSDINPFAR